MTSDLDLTYPRVPTFGLEQNSSKMKEIGLEKSVSKFWPGGTGGKLHPTAHILFPSLCTGP